MSYRRREPVPEKAMLKDRYAGHHTICETLREIYQMSSDEDIKLKCRLAMSKDFRDIILDFRDNGRGWYPFGDVDGKGNAG